MSIIVTAIRYLSNLLVLIIIADIIISYFLNPFHPIRRTLDSIVQPMLQPIRRIMPQTGMIDFSPVVLLILVQVVEIFLIWVIGLFV